MQNRLVVTKTESYQLNIHIVVRKRCPFCQKQCIKTNLYMGSHIWEYMVKLIVCRNIFHCMPSCTYIYTAQHNTQKYHLNLSNIFQIHHHCFSSSPTVLGSEVRAYFLKFVPKLCMLEKQLCKCGISRRHLSVEYCQMPCFSH